MFVTLSMVLYSTWWHDKASSNNIERTYDRLLISKLLIQKRIRVEVMYQFLLGVLEYRTRAQFMCNLVGLTSTPFAWNKSTLSSLCILSGQVLRLCQILWWSVQAFRLQTLTDIYPYSSIKFLLILAQQSSVLTDVSLYRAYVIFFRPFRPSHLWLVTRGEVPLNRGRIAFKILVRLSDLSSCHLLIIYP